MTGLGSQDEFIRLFEAQGFVGRSSQSADGAPLWVGQRSADAFVVQITGDPVATKLSFLTIGIEDTKTFVGQFLNRYAAEIGSAFGQIIDGYAGSDLEVERLFGQRVLHVQTITLPPPLGNGQVAVTTRLEAHD